MRLIALAFLMVWFMMASFASAGEPISAEKLFQSKALGTNGKSCATCHPDGRKLENIGDYDDEVLQEIVNFCVRDALKGEMLPKGSEELRTLAAYLRQFQKD